MHPSITSLLVHSIGAFYSVALLGCVTFLQLLSFFHSFDQNINAFPLLNPSKPLPPFQYFWDHFPFMFSLLSLILYVPFSPLFPSVYNPYVTVHFRVPCPTFLFLLSVHSLPLTSFLLLLCHHPFLSPSSIALLSSFLHLSLSFFFRFI